MKSKKLSFNMSKMLIMFALIPLCVGMIVAVILAATQITSSLEEQTKLTLKVASQDLRSYYMDEINTTGDIAYDTSYVDHLKNDGVELTIFKGDTRFATSLIGADGKRIEGTKAGDAVISECLNGGQDFYSDNVVINNNNYYVYYTPMTDKAGKTFGMAFAGKTCDAVKAAETGIVIKLVVVAVVAIIIFAIAALVLAKKVAMPLEDSAETLEKLANGDLSARTSTRSSIDETSRVLGATSKLRDSLENIISQTKNISNSLTADAANVSSLSSRSEDGAMQIADAMEDLAQGATSMAENVQNINEQVIEMGMAIDEITENAESLAKSSDAIKIANTDASEYMDKVSASSERSVSAVHDISRQISSTNEAIEEVKAATDAITEIASQTNLLALNASIEAARAGEAGRGFAVVATEISNLSDQSNSMAEKIRDIVKNITEKSERSVELSSEVATIISEEQDYIKETQRKFEVLNDEINNSLEQIANVSKKASDLDKAKFEITSSVQDLSAISEENAASNQEVSASISSITESIKEIAQSSTDTNDRASTLTQTVDYFRI